MRDELLGQVFKFGAILLVALLAIRYFTWLAGMANSASVPWMFGFSLSPDGGNVFVWLAKAGFVVFCIYFLAQMWRRFMG